MSVRIRKVKVLSDQLRGEALKRGFDLEDLVIVSADGKLEKIVGDPVSFLLKRSCCEENGIVYPKCKFPWRGGVCGKKAEFEYKRKAKFILQVDEWLPCCKKHSETARKLGFEVRKL